MSEKRLATPERVSTPTGHRKMTKWGLTYLTNVATSLPAFDNNNYPVP